MRSNGGLIGGKKTVSTSAASGIWAIRDVQREKGASNWVLNIPIITYLVVAGGGGGGSGQATLYMGGGGGAGGYRSSVVGESSGGGASAETPITAALGTNYLVQIGSGGAFTNSTGAGGSNGGNSIFSTITSTGGGGGSGNNGGQNGGSGGGASYTNNTVGNGTANQGYNGGSYTTGGAGTHGGGAGSSGNAPSYGLGLSSNITGAAVVRGRGGQWFSYGAIPANTGAGGHYGRPVAGEEATNGSSGVVILRYPSFFTITIGAGLTGSTSTVDGQKVTTITAGSGNVSWS